MRRNPKDERAINFTLRIPMSPDENDLSSSLKSSLASLSLSRSMNVLDDMGMGTPRRTKLKLKEGTSLHDTGQTPSAKAALKLSLSHSYDFKEGMWLRKRSSDTPSVIERKFLCRHRSDNGFLRSPNNQHSLATTKMSKQSQRDSLDSIRKQNDETGNTDHGNVCNHDKPSSFVCSDTDSDTKSERKFRAKVKLRHSSKSIAMDLNDTNSCQISQKKKKHKRPLTSTSESVELFSGNHLETTSANNKCNCTACRVGWNVRNTERDNLPPICLPKNNKTRSEDSSSLSGVKCKSSGRKNCTCSKCQKMQLKLNAQAQLAKTLEEQNMCLESLVDQKKSLVEQLTKQIQMLVKENQKLSRRRPAIKYEPILPKASSTKQKDNTTLTDLQDTSDSLPPLNSLPQGPDLTQTSNSEKTFKETGTNPSVEPDPEVKVEVVECEETCGPEQVPIGPLPWKDSISSDLPPSSSLEIEPMNSSCEVIKKDSNEVQKENIEINRFLSDLLYTLNARGYESITDHDGNSIDLFRCKGEAFLELKGRDARLRAPVRRVAPQETLLKAVIGSQERIIQNLMCQLDDFQRYALAQGNSASNSEANSQSRRSMILEGEILSLFSLLEGVCQRNPAIYQVLRDQQSFDAQIKAHSGVTIGNAIVDLALERCKKVICTSLSPGTANTVPTNRPRRLKTCRAVTPIARLSPQLMLTKPQVSRTSLIKEQNHSSVVARIPISSHKLPNQDTIEPSFTSNDVNSEALSCVSGERLALLRPTNCSSPISGMPSAESIQQCPQMSDPP